MGAAVQIQGLTVVLQRLNRMASSAQHAGRSAYWVGFGAAYAPFVELGTRRMAGRFMLTHAFQSLAPTIPQAVGQDVAAGRDADTSLRKIAFEVLARTQAQTPVRTGYLRGSARVSTRGP